MTFTRLSQAEGTGLSWREGMAPSSSCLVCARRQGGGREAQGRGRVSRVVAAPSWPARSRIVYRDNAVERLDIAVLSSVRSRCLRNVSAERFFCALDLDRKDTPQHRRGNRNNQITYASVSD